MQCIYPNTNATSKAHFNAANKNARNTNTTINTLFNGTWSELNNSESVTSSLNVSENTLGNNEAEKSDSTDGSVELISLVNDDCETVDSKELSTKTIITRRGSMMNLTKVDFANVSFYVITNAMNLIVKRIDELVSLFFVNRGMVKMNVCMRMNETKECMLTPYYFRNIYKFNNVLCKSSKLTYKYRLKNLLN